MNDQPNSDVMTKRIARYTANPKSQYTSSLKKLGLKKTTESTKKATVGREYEMAAT